MQVGRVGKQGINSVGTKSKTQKTQLWKWLRGGSWQDPQAGWGRGIVRVKGDSIPLHVCCMRVPGLRGARADDSSVIHLSPGAPTRVMGFDIFI